MEDTQDAPWREALAGVERLSRPNLLVVGAPRSGTTSLYHVLAEHPEIYMSPLKEPQFLAYVGRPPWRGPHDAQGVRALGEYRRLFEGAGDEPVVGEASTLYLWSDQAAEIARRLLPKDTKAIAMLRDPSLAAWSRFIKARGRGIEDREDIFDAFEAEARRREEGWSPFWYYRALRDYGPQLERWFDAFGRDRVHVVLLEEYKADPDRVVGDVYRYLGVDETFRADVRTKYNRSGLPQDNLAARILRSRNPLKRLARLLPERHRERIWVRLRGRSVAPQPCPDEVKRALSRLFEPEIARTEAVLGRSLDAWRHHER